MEVYNFFKEELTVVNIGVKHFGDSLKSQNIEVAQVGWRPPVDKKLVELLRKVL